MLKPRRSALYVPVNHPRALSKAPGLNCDVLIYDFEDAVLDPQKHQARQDLSAHLLNADHHCEVVIRINSVKTAAFYDDIQWLTNNDGIDAVLLPKVRQASEIELAQSLLDEHNLPVHIWILVETVDAVLSLNEIAHCIQPGCALVLGAEDLAKEMRISPTPGRLGLLPILTQLVLNARQAGLSVIDAVFPNLEHQLGLKQACEQAKNLGFDGKSLIHPAQISVANQAFSPTPIEINRAEEIIRAWHDKPEHLGVVTVGGDVIEKLHVEQAEDILRLADKLK